MLRAARQNAGKGGGIQVVELGGASPIQECTEKLLLTRSSIRG